MEQILGTTLMAKREEKNITIAKAAKDLRIKKEHLEALEAGDWQALPEPPFVRGFIKNYSDYLGLDSEKLLALYRREYDAAKHPSAQISRPKIKHFFITPQLMVTIASLVVATLFIAYLTLQYLSIAASPKLEVTSPPADTTTSAPAVKIEGKTEPGATVSVNGNFAPVDSGGNFTYEYSLKNGQNIIEIIAAKRLSPKSKTTRIVRLSR